MDAVGSGGEGDVGAGVDEEGGFQFAVLSSQFADDGHRFAGQAFEVAGGEIFFTELDVVDVVGCGFGDFVQEEALAGEFAAGEGPAISDVVEATFGHSLSVVSLRQVTGAAF